jgi:hypothetical protein
MPVKKFDLLYLCMFFWKIKKILQKFMCIEKDKIKFVTSISYNGGKKVWLNGNDGSYNKRKRWWSLKVQMANLLVISN